MDLLPQVYPNVAIPAYGLSQIWWGEQMALVQINIRGEAVEGGEALLQQAITLPRGSSVTVMTHGYRFSPDHPKRTPHGHILSLDKRDCWKAVSWPRHLRLDRPEAGLGVALGWDAMSALPRTAARAHDVGVVLAGVLNAIHVRRPDLQVNLLAHSLGARVVLSALSACRAGAVDRVILMSGAEYRSAALAAMTSPAGRMAQVLNVCSTENALFDGLFRLCVPASVLADRALSAGLPNVPGWTDLRIDDAGHRAVLRGLGIRTRAPTTRICHWSTYLRPGLFKLYRTVFDPARPEVLMQLSGALQATATARPDAPLSEHAACPTVTA